MNKNNYIAEKLNYPLYEHSDWDDVVLEENDRNFDTKNGFWILLDLMKESHHWDSFLTTGYVSVLCPCCECDTIYMNIDLINPTEFRDKVFDYFQYMYGEEE